MVVQFYIREKHQPVANFKRIYASRNFVSRMFTALLWFRKELKITRKCMSILILFLQVNCTNQPKIQLASSEIHSCTYSHHGTVQILCAQVKKIQSHLPSQKIEHIKFQGSLIRPLHSRNVLISMRSAKKPHNNTLKITIGSIPGNQNHHNIDD